MKSFSLLYLPFFIIFINACTTAEKQETCRTQVDTVGFATLAWQMDSIIARIPENDRPVVEGTYRTVICPHDDYAYAGGLYTRSLAGVKAPVVLMVGVAHKARTFGLQDRIVFGSSDCWDAPYGAVQVSPLNDSLQAGLSPDLFIVHDSMMNVEHSLEAIVPFLQYNNREVQIIPILVPYMTFGDMKVIAAELAAVLQGLMERNHLLYGRDLAIVISNDALHYGDEDWGGADMAPFGCDSAGNARANMKDLELIASSLTGQLSVDRVQAFYTGTVKPDDYKAYAWTWCGRYSVPFGLLLSLELNRPDSLAPLSGELLGYRSSILNPHIPVTDLGMGTTAPATDHHWVSYVGVAYR